MANPLPPFSCTYPPAFSQLLYDLGCTIAITTYQAGKVIFISAQDPDRLVQLPRTFEKPMGMALEKGKLAIATRHEVVVLANAPAMAPTYPRQPNTYDALFVPRSVYYTGELDIHDLHWQNNELWAVNTRFSCLATIDSNYSFTPRWKPRFISQLTPNDNCHLNGLATSGSEFVYLSALGQTDTPKGWKPTKANGGILIDIKSNEIVASQLPMPHSPRIYDGKVFILLSATGEVAIVDTATGKYEAVKKLQGFVRGMDRIGDYLFIGLSKLRKTSVAFGDLPIARDSPMCGVVAIHLPTLSIVGHIKFETSVEEIYDVKVIANSKRPGIINHLKEDFRMGLTTPDVNFWAIKQEENEEKN